MVSGMIVTEARCVSCKEEWWFESEIARLHRGLIIKCRSDEFAVFNPPARQTCLTWAGEFVSFHGGYLDNPEDTSDCRYCQYKVINAHSPSEGPFDVIL